MKFNFTRKGIAALSISAILSSSQIMAQNTPVIKIDLDQTGRPTAEVTEPGYTAWPLKTALADSLSIVHRNSSNEITDSVQIKFTRIGEFGTNLRTNWYKAGIELKTYFSRLLCDGIYVDGGNAGGKIEMRISNLKPGKHTVLAYINTVDNPATNTFSPVNVYYKDVLVAEKVKPGQRVTEFKNVQLVYIEVDAVAGEDVVVRFEADRTTTDAWKNVMINGIEINTPNSLRQAQYPFPSNNNEHINIGPSKSVRLSWSKALTAAKSRVYFGQNREEVQNATTASSLYKGEQTDTFFVVNDMYSRNQYYWRVDQVEDDGDVTKGDVWYYKPAQLAFKDAEGYGRFALGGRGGKIVHVTNLNDAGPGSLREAVTNDIGPRTIVFDVSGIIELKSRLVLANKYVTVAGQTAPGNGITIKGSPFGIGGHDAVVRFVRLRLGAGETADGMGMNGDHSIMDHCSISWTIDEAFSSRGSKSITLQRTLISEALHIAGHKNYPAGTGHGYAATIGGDTSSFHHNLLAHNHGRNWSLGGGLDGNGFYSGRLDIRNNVVYNWGSRSTDGGANKVNFVNNYYKRGAGTTQLLALRAQHENVGAGTQQYYFAGNVMPGRFDESNQELGRGMQGTATWETWVNEPFFESHVKTQPAYEAYKNVLSDVGASQPYFDLNDQRMIRETYTGTFTYRGSKSGLPGIIDTQEDVGGYEAIPETSRPDNWDTDKDGLPDWWEKAKGLNPNSAEGDYADTHKDDNGDGFTQLDEYLDWMASAHYFINKGQSLEIDLLNYARGYANGAKFTITKTDNGSTSLVSSTDSKAVFTSQNDGFASFEFTVTDAEGHTYTRTINIFIDSEGSLPVTLVTFTGKREQPSVVALEWKTSSEVNNNYFEVQRSLDLNKFTTIGKQPSKAVNGNSSNDINYQFKDNQNAFDQSYYRLVQVDKNGTKTISNIVSIGNGNNATAAKVYVGKDKLSFQILVSGNSNYTAEILNANGVKLQTLNVNSGELRTIKTSAPGLHLVRFTDAKTKQVISTQKVVVL